MQKPENLKKGDQFRVIEGYNSFELGEIITLKKDDCTNCPYFWNENKSNSNYIFFSKIEPVTKTIRDAQVGDVVIRGGNERLVLERGQSTVMLSRAADFEVVGISYIFDQLEKHFTLKDAPVAVDEKIAEAMKVLEEAGYKITKE